MKPTPLTSEEQQAQFGQVALRRKPLQIDLLTGEASAKKPKAGHGHHIRYKDPGQQPTIGMAFFAGTGPEGKYCKDCDHYGDLPVYRKKGGTLQRYEKGACAKAAQMSEGRVQRGGIAANRSCKYFEPKS